MKLMMKFDFKSLKILLSGFSNLLK